MKARNTDLPDLMKKRVAEIIALFTKGPYSESPIPPAFIDSKTGSPVSGADLMPDLGDYLPFLYHYGEVDYSISQLKKIAEKWVKHGGIEPRPTRAPFIKARYSFDLSDYLFGLILLIRMGEKTFSPLLAGKAIRRLRKNFIRNRKVAHIKLLRPFSFLNYFSSDGAIFIELFLMWSSLMNDSECRTLAVDMAEAWLGDPMFRRFGVLPARRAEGFARLIPTLSRGAGEAILYKHNSSLLAGLIALCQGANHRHRMLVRHIEGIKSLFERAPGEFIYRASLRQNHPAKERVPLRNNILIELFTDAAVILDRPDFIESAQRIAQYWLDRKSPHTGLIPEEDGADTSEIDSLTDFVVNLLRLFRVTGKKNFREEAVSILEAQMRYHWTVNGYASKCDIKTGEITNTLVEIRFTSLALKPFMALDSPAGNESEAFPAPYDWLLKDR